MPTLVLTVLGEDRAGLVSAVSTQLEEHGASWERSQMARLAGKFAGIVEVVVADHRVEALTAALQALSAEGLEVTVEASEPVPLPASRLTLDLVGADRPGIVAKISSLLAEHGVSVEELSTWVRAAPMAGGMLFEAHAVLAAPGSAGTTELRQALEAVADELMVDIALVAD